MVVFISFVVIILSLIYVYLKYNYNYWARRGVPQLNKSVVENFLLAKTVHGTEIAHEVYKEFKNKAQLAGSYMFFTPYLYVLDLDLIKQIMIKDFNYFPDRFTDAENNESDPLSLHLFRLNGDTWRVMRSKLSPTFTSGKMKTMFPSIVEVANELNKLYERDLLTSKNGVFEIYDINSRYTTDVIGTCIFGLKANSLENPDSEFRENGKKIFSTKPVSARLRAFILEYITILKFIGITTFSRDVLHFMTRVVKDILREREGKHIFRNDFMNLLIELRNKPDQNGKPSLTVEQIVSQTFVFFTAGFETSASNLSFCLLELAKHPEIQEQVRQEIHEVLAKNNGELTYEMMKEVKLLQQCIKETLRLYPALGVLKRIANADYKVPNSNIVISKGTNVMIPVKDLHSDPDLFENPHEFRPERFTPENIAARHPMAYLPFGDGPRNCIGLRFGNMQTTVGLLTLLKNYRFSLCDDTPKTFQPPTYQIVHVPGEGIPLKVEKV